MVLSFHLTKSIERELIVNGEGCQNSPHGDGMIEHKMPLVH